MTPVRAPLRLSHPGRRAVRAGLCPHPQSCPSADAPLIQAVLRAAPSARKWACGIFSAARLGQAAPGPAVPATGRRLRRRAGARAVWARHASQDARRPGTREQPRNRPPALPPADADIWRGGRGGSEGRAWRRLASGTGRAEGPGFLTGQGGCRRPTPAVKNTGPVRAFWRQQGGRLRMDLDCDQKQTNEKAVSYFLKFI